MNIQRSGLNTEKFSESASCNFLKYTVSQTARQPSYIPPASLNLSLEVNITSPVKHYKLSVALKLVMNMKMTQKS